MTRRVTAVASLALGAALVLAGCSGEDQAASSGDAPADLEAPPSISEQTDELNFEQPAKPEVRVLADSPIVKVLVLGEFYRAALVDRSAVTSAQDLEAIARPVCEDTTPCRVGLWYDEASMPTELPVTVPQLEEQAFAFGRIYDGTENALWNCNIFPEFEAEHLCLPRDMT